MDLCDHDAVSFGRATCEVAVGNVDLAQLGRVSPGAQVVVCPGLTRYGQRTYQYLKLWFVPVKNADSRFTKGRDFGYVVEDRLYLTCWVCDEISSRL